MCHGEASGRLFQTRAARRERGRDAADFAQQQRDGQVLVPRRLARDHHVQADAQAPAVGLLAVRRRRAAQVDPCRHLWRHIHWRAAQPLEGLLGGAAARRGAQVDELDRQLGLRHAQAHVLRLHVAVRPAVRVQVGQCARQLHEEPPRLLLGVGAPAPLNRAQHVAAVEQLELERELAGRAHHTVERRDVRVIRQLVQRLHLRTHHAQHLGALAQRRHAQHLERDAPSTGAPRGDEHPGGLSLADEVAHLKVLRQVGRLQHSARCEAQKSLRKPDTESLRCVELAPQSYDLRARLVHLRVHNMSSGAIRAESTRTRQHGALGQN